jgi:hypothetical protein
MRDALKRLQELRQELEDLHETTARVLADSERLIDQLQSPEVLTAPLARRTPVPRARRGSPGKRKAASSK